MEKEMVNKAIVMPYLLHVKKRLRRNIGSAGSVSTIIMILVSISLLYIIISKNYDSTLPPDLQYATIIPPLSQEITKLRVDIHHEIKCMKAKTQIGRILDFVGGTAEENSVKLIEKYKPNSCRRRTSFGEISCHRDECPLPSDFIGRHRVDLKFHTHAEVEDLLQHSSHERERGSWRPRSCAARHRVAIIIPYRDRMEHLSTLLYTLHPLLQRQLLEYRFYVVEQYGNDTFNKGVLMNAGVREALRDSDFQCFVFHDVDMIPEDDRNMYSCPFMPRHLSFAVDKFNYTLPYHLLVGGVFAIKLEHFLTVNGYSNLYWGWGGEDDDMGYRIKYRKLEIIRPPETIARYSMIKHDHRAESPNAIRSALLRMSKKRSSRDGLNTVKYRLIWRREHLAYTHLMIDIGKHHRWQFLNGQRLIINF